MRYFVMLLIIVSFVASADSVDLAVRCLKHLEGFTPTPKWDVNAYRGGYGMKLQKGETSITKKMATSRLKSEVVRLRTTVRGAVKVSLTSNQEAALICFVFNVGTSAFKSSTLVKLLNKGNYVNVPVELTKWVYVEKTKSQGLINRRTKEIQIWNG